MSRNLIPTRNSSRTAAAPVTLAMILVFMITKPGVTQTEARTFSSAEQAAQALYEAVRNEDGQAVQAILGAAPELSFTGDDTEDKLEHERFAQKYQEMHRLVREADGSVVLYIGAENWPFPIPLITNDRHWYFDSVSGAQEIGARRVGENETIAIEVCRVLRKEDGAYKEKTGTEDSVEFARDLNKAESPGTSGPFHGYYFRVVSERHGDSVVVAYPAEYGASGVMTFVVRGNTIYEKDLGPQTASVAQAIGGKPAGKWNRVQ